jgi:hypothetical protein
MSKEAAKVVAVITWPLFAIKFVTLIGSIVSTLGVVTFFFFNDLEPYRWWLILGGIGLSVIAIFAEQKLLQKWANIED